MARKYSERSRDWIEKVRGADLRILFPVFLVLSILLFARSPATNFIFDEQEALLANPFLAERRPFYDAFTLDFWGLPPERTIGSYRPLPSLLWRGLAFTLDYGTPYYFHIVNLVLHAFVALEVSRVARRVTSSPIATWGSGLVFLSFGIAPEAVSGVVGVADELVALFAVLGAGLLLGADERLSWKKAGLLLLVVLGGFFAKETMIGAVAVYGLFLLLPNATSLKARALSAGAISLGLGGFLLTKRLCFPVRDTLSTSSLSDVPLVGSWIKSGLRFWAQPTPSIDFMNNPLVDGNAEERVAVALEVFYRSVKLVFWPFFPSGDYSYAEFSLHRFDVSSAVGLGLLLGGSLLGFAMAWRRSTRLLGFGILWLMLTALPTANLFVLLPTIRADRLWYLPSVGAAWFLGAVAQRYASEAPRLVAVAFAFFVGMQGLVARLHANDYRSDLAFWEATVRTSPKSAKARLNLGVMVGARGKKLERLTLTRSAVALAPDWPMGNVYLADSLCRSGRPDEAWPHYEKGFRLGPNQKSLIALGLQCLWDQKAYSRYAVPLRALSAQVPGSWLEYLERELTLRGAENDGLPPEYRPRGYNQKHAQPRSQKSP